MKIIKINEFVITFVIYYMYFLTILDFGYFLGFNSSKNWDKKNRPRCPIKNSSNKYLEHRWNNASIKFT